MSNLKNFVFYWGISVVSGLMIYYSFHFGKPESAWIPVFPFILSILGILSIALSTEGIWGHKQKPKVDPK